MFDRQKYIGPFSDILSLRDLADGTVSNYLSYLNQYFDFLEQSLNAKVPEDATWEDVRAYVRQLKDLRNLNNRSINPHIAQLRDFYRYVLHKDWDRYQVPFLKYDEYLPNVPTKKEMEEIIGTMSDLKYKCIIAVMYSAGLRVSEACRLTYDDVSRSKMQIHVAKSKNRAERKAILAHKTLDLLTAYWFACGKPMGYLFPGQKPDTHITKESVRRTMHKHLDSIGMGDRGFTPHSCRHCFGLTLYEAGTDLLAIRDAMGHKSISSTTVYASLGIGSDPRIQSPFDMEG